LTSTLPSGIGNWRTINTFNVCHFCFAGIIYAYVILNTFYCPYHICKQAAFNNLNGTLPLQMGSCSELRQLNLQGNQLSGPIPTTVDQWTALLSLQFEDNRFSGSLPEVIGSLESLTYFGVCSFFPNFAASGFVTQFLNLCYFAMLYNRFLTTSLLAVFLQQLDN